MGENLALNFERNGFAVSGFDLDPRKRESFTLRTRGKRAQCGRVAGRAGCRPAGAAPHPADGSRRRPRRHRAGRPSAAAGRRRRGDRRRQHPLHRHRSAACSSSKAPASSSSARASAAARRARCSGRRSCPAAPRRPGPSSSRCSSRIAARADDGQPCCEWMGPGGAGHFVKMVHNGIEYADMQMICEAFWLMQELLGMSPADMSRVFAEWNDGELGSYLIEHHRRDPCAHRRGNRAAAGRPDPRHRRTEGHRQMGQPIGAGHGCQCAHHRRRGFRTHLERRQAGARCGRRAS